MRLAAVLVVLGLVAGGCGEEPENAGFERAPIEAVDSIAYEGFPGSVEIDRRSSIENTNNSPYAHQFTCDRTVVLTYFDLGQDVLFSELVKWHAEQASADGWTIDNREDGLPVAWTAEKSIGERRHKFQIFLVRLDVVQTYQLDEDSRSDGYAIQYWIGLHPDHPFCPEL